MHVFYNTALILVIAALTATEHIECNMESLLSTILPPILQVVGYSPNCMKEAIQLANQDGSVIAQALETLKDIRTAVQDLKTSSPDQGSNQSRPKNCAELYKEGHNSTEPIKIFPYSCCPNVGVTVICDQESDGGGWTILQKRLDTIPREDFYRTWQEYVLGFGHLKAEFWVGLKLIHELTSQNLQELYIALEDYDGNKWWAKYGYFHVDGPETKYKLSIGRYSGDAGDAFASRHNGFAFSTHDQDNDAYEQNCAKAYKGGWWYDKCHTANLNGFQHRGPHTSYADGINWHPWLGYKNSLKKVTMKIRPAF